MSASTHPSALEREFERAAEAYARSRGGSLVTPAAREAAAREFVDGAARFWSGGVPALELAVARLDGPYAAIASRLLLLASDPAAPAMLIAACLGPRPPRLPREQVASLGRGAPLPAATWSLVGDPDRVDQPGLLRALLRDPTPRARALLDETLRRGSEPDAAAAVRAAAGWGDTARLRSWLDGDEPRRFQLEAALQLALGGDRAAVAWLERIAVGRGTAAAEACRQLSLIAWPGAVGCVARWLRGGDHQAAAVALESVRLLGAMALGPALLDLLPDDPAQPEARSDAGARLPDLAVTALGDLTGVPFPDDLREYGPPGFPPADYTPASRRAAVRFYRERLARFDPRLRYLGAAPNRLPVEARPITLGLLVDALLDAGNPELGVAAAHQLRAMTGEHHGFDPDEDTIANLPAITAWRVRAAAPLPGEPGGWIYQARPLAPPEVP